MPNPKKFKNKKSFLDSCIPQVVDEGKDQDQAVAICNSMWDNRNKKSKSKKLWPRDH